MDIGTGDNILKPSADAYSHLQWRILDLEAKLKVAVEALEKYGDKDLWSIGGGTNEIPCLNKFMEHSIDTEWFEKYRHHVSGGIARLALEKIKAK